MSGIHAVLGIALLAANGLAAAWGAVAWARKRPSVAFWPLLRLAQAVVAAQVVLGLILLARGAQAPDGLHLAYGIAPLVITLVSEGMRVGAAQRELAEIDDLEQLDRPQQVAVARRVAISEMGVMTVGLLLILTLSLRAYQTGG
ncbi:MAG: hypothetical protein M3133_02855 [Actinomycetota bacterium]|nr:hypothetical protein [Actinomycetota bacterium]